MAVGSISAEQFVKVIEAMLRQSELLGDTWQLEGLKKEEQYLSKKETKVLKKLVTSVGLEEHVTQDMEEEHELADDDSSVVNIPNNIEEMLCTCEYHIVYSASYGVPVLYFNMYKQDGKLLSLEELWSTVPASYQERLKFEKWTFITQQEHPVLGRPFFQLHPCHTEDLMKQVKWNEKDSIKPSNYIVSWLSSVGPVVHLNLSMKYADTPATVD